MKKAFNRKSGAIFEYHLVMSEKVQSENSIEQRDATAARAQDFALLLNGWGMGSKDRQRGSFDGAAPVGEAHATEAYQKFSRPMVKVFCTPNAMSRLQAAFKQRIYSVTRAGKWTPQGFSKDAYAWKHPRGGNKKPAAAPSPAAQGDGYT